MFLVTIAEVAVFDQFLGTFESTGPRSAESKQRGAKSPGTPMSDRVWVSSTGRSRTTRVPETIQLFNELTGESARRRTA